MTRVLLAAAVCGFMLWLGPSVGHVVTDQPATAPTPYTREAWHPGWAPSPLTPGTSVRDEVLMRASESIPGSPTEIWKNAYRSWVPLRREDIDVDHVVPLRWAHEHGGWRWSTARKRDFANSLEYPRHLVVTSATDNRAKGAKGPDEWEPPAPSRHCQYAESWALIIVVWELEVDGPTRAAIRRLARSCHGLGG